MVFRIEKEVPDAPVAASAGNVTYACDDRTETIIDPVTVHVACFPYAEDPWHRKLALEVRHTDQKSVQRDVPSLLLLMTPMEVAHLIEALASTYDVMMQTSSDRAVN